MSNKLYNYYKDLPPWAKGITAVAGLAVAGFVGYKLYRIVFPTSSDKKSQQFIKSISNDIDRFRLQGMTPSYPDAQYKTYANSIYNGMRYAIGDDYGLVEEILKKMQNDLDVALLIDAFGIKQNFAFGIPTGDPIDMITMIKSELGNDYFGLTDYRVQRVNRDWQTKGITYKI